MSCIELVNVEQPNRLNQNKPHKDLGRY